MEQFLIFQHNLPPEDSHKESHRDCTKSADTAALANFEGSALQENCSEELRDVFPTITICALYKQFEKHCFLSLATSPRCLAAGQLTSVEGLLACYSHCMVETHCE